MKARSSNFQEKTLNFSQVIRLICLTNDLIELRGPGLPVVNIKIIVYYCCTRKSVVGKLLHKSNEITSLKITLKK